MSSSLPLPYGIKELRMTKHAESESAATHKSAKSDADDKKQAALSKATVHDLKHYLSEKEKECLKSCTEEELLAELAKRGENV